MEIGVQMSACGKNVIWDVTPCSLANVSEEPAAYTLKTEESVGRENEVEQIVRNGEKQKGCDQTNGRHVP
jgi:hypothetical protein